MVYEEISKTEKKFYKTISELGEREIEKVKKVAKKLVENISAGGDQVGLIYGKVQSGKTNTIIASVARSNDNGFKFFVILTSDNISLYNQTLDRVRKGVRSLQVLGNDDLKNFDGIIGRSRITMNKKGIVIVSKKNAANLVKLQEYLEQLDVSNTKAVVFDDEADYGSLNSKVNSEERSEQSRIHSLIVTLQRMFQETKFIQVTATPQAVFLQRQGGRFRPQFVVQIEPGSSYIGGDELLNIDNPTVVDKVQRRVITSEIDTILNRTDYSQSGLSAIPEGIRKAVSVFVVGASCKSVIKGANQNFAMLCHISSKKAANESLYSLINRYVQIISENIDVDDENDAQYKGVLDDLKVAFNDISSTLNGEVQWPEVLSDIKDNIYSTNVQLIISGRHGQDPSYTSLYNILIGGDRLGRGLTIDNLTVTYYGRQSGAPKLDTMLQHSRMYGYRQDMLDIMRIFSTEDLLRIYHDVYNSDKEEWEYFAGTDGDRLVLPVILSLEKGERLRATRSQVIPLENVLKYFPGKAYIMYDAIPQCTNELDSQLASYGDGLDYPVETTFDFIKTLIDLPVSSDLEQRWNANALRKVIDRMKNRSPADNEDDEENEPITPYLLVRRGRNEKRDYRAILSSEDNRIRRDNGLILFLYRLTGVGKGWDGEPVWVPVIRFPEGRAYYFTVGYVVPGDGEDRSGEPEDHN